MQSTSLVQVMVLTASISLTAHATSSVIDSSAKNQQAHHSSPAHSLAQGCYSIQSPHTGKWIKRSASDEGIHNELDYGFFNIHVHEASRFYFKPTELNHYLMTDQDSYYLATHAPSIIIASQSANRFSEWQTRAITQENGSLHYQFNVTGLNKTLRYDHQSNTLAVIELPSVEQEGTETAFTLVAQEDCTPFAEITTNVSGNIDALKGSIDQAVRGFIDPHTHITSYQFMGGRFMHGQPFHRFGVEHALSDSSAVHGRRGALDIIGNILAYNDITYRYDTRGWPEFPHWPNHKQMSHMGYYYKWIERAYLSGQRMIVTHLVENEVLCRIQSKINPASWDSHNSCNTMDSIRLQVESLNQMQDYIDAQAGGIGQGFFRLVTSPEQAREVIANGQLAVLMGIEASETFNCGLKDTCSRFDVEQQLQQVYDLGVRIVYPTHKFDNRFGGSRVEDSVINIGQVLSTGYAFDAKECDDFTHGINLHANFPQLTDLPIIKEMAKTIIGSQYPPELEHCNQQGLSELGVYLVNRMIDKKMLIELDHMSEKTASSVMDIVEARHYSGVISSHSWMNLGKNGELHRNFKRAVHVGGFVTPYNWTSNQIANTISQYLDEVEQTTFVHGVGFATDMSGLGEQPGPREDAHTRPLNYPFTSEFGLLFNRQQSGNRTYDYNYDGMAHYGMVADHLQDIREQAPTRIYESIMNSAEAYLQMWERAKANDNNEHHNPLELYVRLVNWSNGNCIDIAGDDDQVTDGKAVQQYDCQHQSDDQQWIYDKSSQTLRNRVNPQMCLDNRNQAHNNGNIGISQCNNSDAQRWVYDGYRLRAQQDQNYVIDVWGASNGNFVGSWHFDGSSSQAWELRPQREVYLWSTLRNHQGGRCLTLPNNELSNGDILTLAHCRGGDNQQWFYDPKHGNIHTRLDWNKCVALTNADITNNTPIIISDCNNAPAQQWDNDGGYFRSRIDSTKVINAKVNEDNAAITIWDDNASANQRWRNALN